MTISCPICNSQNEKQSGSRTIIRIGKFYRKSDSTFVQRFRCQKCLKGFFRATFHPCYRQNKRHKNEILRRLLCSGVSQRRAAKILTITRTTVVRKFIFLSIQAKKILRERNQVAPSCTIIEFDDMESFEHTKCKPLAITLAVEHKSRRILGFSVSQMKPKSTLHALASKKYGPRKDLRYLGRRQLFREIRDLINPCSTIKSDQNPHYPKDVREFFPRATHKKYKGRKGCIVGQGELKKIGFDPLFTLNHTCAMFRANVNRLIRKTWCTTKKAHNLAHHLALYAVYHNENLK